MKNKEIEKHEQLKQCAIFSYGKNPELPPGYKCTNTYVNPKTGFSSSVIKNGNEVIIAYRGTEPTDIKDIGADLKMALNQMPAQAKDAFTVYMKVKMANPDANITLTGHSLGGSLAQIVGSITDTQTVTFNAYGTKNIISPDTDIYPDKIVNYINLNDNKIITDNTNNQIGKCYSIGTKGFSKNNHEAESMLPLENRAIFNQKTYGNSKKVQGRQSKEIHTGETNCTGSYPVSGYTRSDGTKVNDYVRSCYIHGTNSIRSYFGKTLDDMTDSEVRAFWKDYI